MPGVMGQPYPYEFLMTPGKVTIIGEAYMQVRHIFTDGRPLPADPDPTFNGTSVGKWEGDTLVIDSIGFKDERVWIDENANPHSDALHVVERYTRTGPDQLLYEATIEDPKVFTRPWKMSMPLYRRIEKNAQLFEYKCVEFVEELMYGHLRKKAGT
jgi:hypothetical protein